MAATRNGSRTCGLANIGSITRNITRTERIRSRPSHGSKRKSIRKPDGTDSLRRDARELFLFELDVAYAAFDGEVDSVGGFAIGGVDVLAIFVSLEAVDIDGAESTMNDGDYANILG